MKKVFMKPTMKVADLEMESIIATSKLDIAVHSDEEAQDGEALGRNGNSNMWDSEW